jgi:hypothetical protein
MLSCLKEMSPKEAGDVLEILSSPQADETHEALMFMRDRLLDEFGTEEES